MQQFLLFAIATGIGIAISIGGPASDSPLTRLVVVIAPVLTAVVGAYCIFWLVGTFARRTYTVGDDGLSVPIVPRLRTATVRWSDVTAIEEAEKRGRVQLIVETVHSTALTINPSLLTTPGEFVADVRQTWGDRRDVRADP